LLSEPGGKKESVENTLRRCDIQDDHPRFFSSGASPADLFLAQRGKSRPKKDHHAPALPKEDTAEFLAPENQYSVLPRRVYSHRRYASIHERCFPEPQGQRNQEEERTPRIRAHLQTEYGLSGKGTRSV